MAETQSYANHTRYYPLFHFVVLPILGLNLLLQIVMIFRHPNRWSVWNAIVAFGLAALAYTTRMMILRVQDRLIRLEERLRLQQILPTDLRARVGELTTGQLIGLRFCDDAEVPELCRAVLSGELKGRKQIKQRITKWKPDTLRA